MKKVINLFLIPLLAGVIFLPACSKSDDGTQNNNNNINTQVKVNDTIAFGTLNAQELMFDNVHYALGSTVLGGSAIAINGQSVGAIPDKKGKANMTYIGDAAPTITGAPPTIIDDKFIAFENRPNTNYQSATVATINPPYEAWIVTRIMPGQRYESRMQGGGNGLYLGDLQNDIRIMDSSLGEMTSTTVPANYIVNVERLVVNSNKTADYWQNGVKKGSISISGISSYQLTKTFHAIGVFTNSMDFDWAALYFKAGTPFDDATAATIYASLADKWKVGVQPTNRILLSNIKWTNVGGTYTPSATVMYTPDGVTVADPSKWDYQWYWHDDQGNLGTQVLFSTNMVVHTGDFPADDATHTNVAIKFRVRPKDTKGANAWRYFSGTFGVYSLPFQQ